MYKCRAVVLSIFKRTQEKNAVSLQSSCRSDAKVQSPQNALSKGGLLKALNKGDVTVCAKTEIDPQNPYFKG